MTKSQAIDIVTAYTDQTGFDAVLDQILQDRLPQEVQVAFQVLQQYIKAEMVVDSLAKGLCFVVVSE